MGLLSSLLLDSSLCLGIQQAGLPASSWKAPHCGPTQKDFYSTAEACTAIAETNTSWGQRRGETAQHSPSQSQAATELRQGGSFSRLFSSIQQGEKHEKETAFYSCKESGWQRHNYVWGCTAFGALMNCEMFQKANSYWQWLHMKKGWHKGWENREYCLTQTTVLKYLKFSLSSGE